jgi:transposase
MPKDLRLILANCLTHGRRKFVDVIQAFPVEVKYVVKCLKKVYQTDAEARKQQLSPADRLQLHQEHSRPVMEDLHKSLQEQFDQRKVEPNSSLGGAISYMLKHWDELTLFLRVAGAPLDNNLCEQALKMAIRHRRNSLFYKTMQGAGVGDLYMSLIHTCYLCDADPFHYLTELQRNADRVIAAPGDWTPWNYRKQLDTDEANSDASRPPPLGPAISTPQ